MPYTTVGFNLQTASLGGGGGGGGNPNSFKKLKK